MAVQAAADLFEAPAHPYAAALVGARPRIDQKVKRLQVVPGRPVSALEVSTGCPFRPRCAYAVSDCEQTTPALNQLAPGVLTECIRAGELRDELRESVHVSH